MKHHIGPLFISDVKLVLQRYLVVFLLSFKDQFDGKNVKLKNQFYVVYTFRKLIWCF